MQENKKANNDEVRPVGWAEGRTGDVLMHENGDRVTVERGGEVIVVAVGHELATDAWAHMGFSPYRKQPELPAEPGAYLDKDGDYWLRDRNGNGYDWSCLSEPNPHGGTPEDYAPFTPLVPMPHRDTLQCDIYHAAEGQLDNVEAYAVTDAVLRLLRGEGGENDG